MGRLRSTNVRNETSDEAYEPPRGASGDIEELSSATEELGPAEELRRHEELITVNHELKET